MEPTRYVNGWRFLNLLFLLYLWSGSEADVSGFILLLLLTLLTCLRWRFRLPVWSVLTDALICFLFFPSAHAAYFGLALPVFELALRGKWRWGLPFFLLGLLVPPFPAAWLLWHLALSLFIGMFAHSALSSRERFRQEADGQRKVRHELERLKTDLLAANRSVALQAGLMERYRIARRLHDHLGHDLSGAALALEAYEFIEDPEEAAKVLQEVKRRLEASTASLRETVHDETPTALLGVENLEHAARNFRQADVRFRQAGDLPQVSAYHWALLEDCLKEALTNVARHSDATSVEVNVTASGAIVRLLVQDNGTERRKDQGGSGLRSLQMRACSLGGSLSASGGDNGFRVVCVLPLGEEEET